MDTNSLILSSPSHSLMEEFSSLSSSLLITSDAASPSSAPPESEQVQQREQQQSVTYRISISQNSLAAYEARDDVCSCTIMLLTFWFFVSMVMILGIYGSVDLVLGPNVSRLVQANSLFVQDIKVNTVGEAENGIAMLYGFAEPPPLDVQTTWSETYDVFIPANSHKEWVYYLNEQAHINISYAVKSNTSSPLILVIAQASPEDLVLIFVSGYNTVSCVYMADMSDISSCSESLSQWIENPSNPYIPMSWNVIHGNGTIQQSIIKLSDYYIAVVNLNQQEMEVRLQFGVQTLLYNTTRANYKCSFDHSSCALPLPFLRETVAVLATTCGPRQDVKNVERYVKLSYSPRWITYSVGSGVLTVANLLVFIIFTNFLVRSGNNVEQQDTAAAAGRSPLLLHKEDDHLSLGSSYDSVSDNEEDIEEQLDISTKLLSEGEADNTRRLCAVCCDAQRDSFFLPCGHCAACFTCGTRIADEAGTCPICRRKMKKVRKIFTV